MKVYTTFILSASITRGVTYVKLTHTVAEGRPGYKVSSGRTPNLRFEFLATWPAAIWLRGPKSPFVRPETGLGEGVTFAARRGREVVHL